MVPITASRSSPGWPQPRNSLLLATSTLNVSHIALDTKPMLTFQQVSAHQRCSDAAGRGATAPSSGSIAARLGQAQVDESATRCRRKG